jgi:osmotically-inducible protein OsmY
MHTMRRFGGIGIGLLVAAAEFALFAANAADAPLDAWLTTKAKIVILTSIGTHGTTVQVDTMNATMTLYGKVTSPADKQTVEKSARSVEGVREVRNFLQVVPSADEKSVAASDSMLQSEVAVALISVALKKEGPLSGSNISVQSVDKGTVWLSGTADSLTAHLRALETAKNVPGIRAVRSEIQSPDAKPVYVQRFLGQ